jgi:phosphoglycolate phosphatase
MGPFLYLFDIDGTLIRAGTKVHREAFSHAYRTVYGLPLSLDGVAAAGRTDTWLLAEPLLRHGWSQEEIDRGKPEAFRAIERFTDSHLSDLRDRVLPGVVEVLTRLRAGGYLLGLLTGNLSGVARVKLHHAGLDGFFVTGGYGEESAIRADLVPVALAHASRLTGRAIAPDEVVIIGDTPMDVAAGQSHGTLTVGVATGPFGVEELITSGASLVLPSLADPKASVVALTTLRPA